MAKPVETFFRYGRIEAIKTQSLAAIRKHRQQGDTAAREEPSYIMHDQGWILYSASRSIQLNINRRPLVGEDLEGTCEVVGK